MFTKQITDSVYSVGVLNPNLRIFDIVMCTEYGTSYNSYIVKGKNKTALIETCHSSFVDNYVKNLQEICSLDSIDYIILNHNEPDHSGSLAELLQYVPNAKIVISQAGSIYIKNITNKTDFPIQVVKDGDTIDLGGDTVLKFISAPFLHWPDTMFTWFEKENVLFSCDFLGAHFCEQHVLDTNIVYEDYYKDAFKYYYNCIMGPFREYVQKGLQKIKDLDIKFACTSHGPVLTKEKFLPYALEKYDEWSSENKNDILQIPIFYCTAYGNTEIMAKEIKKGMMSYFDGQNKQVDITLHDLSYENIDDMSNLLNNSDAFLLGSPTINKNAVPPIWQLLSHVDAINCRNKPVATFGSYGWSGEAIPQINSYLENLKYKVFESGLKAVFVPSEQEIKNAFEFGYNFAKTI